ncbi:hypothetical protein EZ313_17345 [Ramlibacter henchirensis]|uniref:Uncharacterized protein n=1 Tax=Ramlibacter henchirensis TaxID=204072 RepID=A0A4Z0BXI5_9BURK|nr:beta family protein [Ramlibacter henchirensis]TFZ02988.1 hypothetical protein EZ313_17345 [Ramlibacter henchirensis]
MATTWKYMPILKWKQGERIALKNLTPVQWEHIVPLLELLPIIATPDSVGLRAELPAYLEKASKQLVEALHEDVPLVIDVSHVAPAYPHQARLLRVVCDSLRKSTKRQIIPVITQATLSGSPADVQALATFAEFVVRIAAPFNHAEAVTNIVKLCVGAALPKKSLHLVVDQRSIVSQAPAPKWTAIQPYLTSALASGCASTTLAGGSFPMNLIGIKQGIHDLPRVEWQIWKLLRKHSEYDVVRFADYTVSNPELGPDVDPLQVNPSVAIRYAADSFWRLYKAGGFKKGAPNQYKSLSKLLISDPIYSGSTFSYGDKQYEQAATNPKVGNGNPSSWRRDATSHHLVLTASAL